MLATTRVKWAALALAPYPLLLLQHGPTPPRVLYERDVKPILKAHCVACHADFATPEGLLKTLKRGDPDHSDLVRRMHGLDGKPAMPKGFPPLPPEKIATIAAWIEQGARTEPPKALFARDVQPILKAHCVSCHAGTSPAGGLDLSDSKAMLQAVIKGDPDHSLLLRRIRGLDGLPAMPKGFGPLLPKETAAIRDWIAEGAYLDGGEATHWAYVAPRLPAVPKVKNAQWVRNPVDAFVLARLEREGLRPAPEADRATLVRRLSLDLTGLPPTPQEADAFRADRRPDAYERVVDRLLASPHYGERMAARWLDLARYADSDGFEKDLNRTAWRYRDWTIDAFNRDEPYDRFVVEQVAGDELPNATVENRVATGFSRNSMQNREGGVDQAEAHFNVVVDRVSTTATVFLGSTLACARCHDHKYDPFTQRDFYRMAAFYANDVVLPHGDAKVSEEKWDEPEIRVPTKAQATELASLDKRIAVLTHTSAIPTGQTPWTVAIPTQVEAERATAKVEADGTVALDGPNAATELTKVELDAPAGTSTALRLETLAGRNPDNLNFVLTGLRVIADGKPVPLTGVTADFAQRGFPPESVLLSDRKAGWAVDPQTRAPHTLIASFDRPLSARHLEVWLPTRSGYATHNLGRFRLALTDSPEPHAEHGKSLSAARRDLLVTRRATLERDFPSAMVLQERPGNAVPTEFVRTRGEFLSPAERVAAGTPACLPPLPSGRPSRLALARWLVEKDNPLTARVEANRLWEGLFGTGLVETSEDFGTQGAPPTHPALLDWLALRLRDGGWSRKALIRTIVTSATYRQSSATTPALTKRDPNDRLLARFPRVRLEAETIRDNALAAAGLLSPKVGGPSVMPDQPDGVWDNPFGGVWNRAGGEDRWRRGLYTYWKRSSPFPMFTALDATSRETCTVRRVRTDTPLQALALLNDAGMMAAAVALGERMAHEGGPDPLAYGFRLATGRRPAPAERARLAALQKTLLKRYTAKPAEATKLGGPERAARTLVANVLLNLDETITKE